MNTQCEATNHYYTLHSKIYDLTRWSFLFGRQNIVERIVLKKPTYILEVGCGTGRNLLQLAKKLPESTLFGLDASLDMLSVAQKKSSSHNITWIHGTFPGAAYSEIVSAINGFDCILFSYALTMFNPGWELALEQALQDLKPNGLLVLVDFDQTKFKWFENWMKFNHVSMQGQIVAWLEHKNISGQIKRKRAYAGIWQYFTFEGTKAI